MKYLLKYMQAISFMVISIWAGIYCLNSDNCLVQNTSKLKLSIQIPCGANFYRYHRLSRTSQSIWQEYKVSELGMWKYSRFNLFHFFTRLWVMLGCITTISIQSAVWKCIQNEKLIINVRICQPRKYKRYSMTGDEGLILRGKGVLENL